MSFNNPFKNAFKKATTPEELAEQQKSRDNIAKVAAIGLAAAGVGTAYELHKEDAMPDFNVPAATAPAHHENPTIGKTSQSKPEPVAIGNLSEPKQHVELDLKKINIEAPKL